MTTPPTTSPRSENQSKSWVLYLLLGFIGFWIAFEVLVPVLGVAIASVSSVVGAILNVVLIIGLPLLAIGWLVGLVLCILGKDK